MGPRLWQIGALGQRENLHKLVHLRIDTESFAPDQKRITLGSMTMGIFSEDYRITSYLVNIRGEAGLYGLLNLIQDSGWQHATSIGLDYAGKGMSWVFTRQKLKIERWPAWNEIVSIRTWLRPAGDSPFVFRDYELFVREKKFAECTSSFTLIDSNTRKVAKPDWGPLEKHWRQAGALSLQPGKIPPLENPENLCEFEVRDSDLDLNNHVNNTRYAQWILDAGSLERREVGVIKEYEINFLAETLKGDLIGIERSKGDGGPELFFGGRRQSDNKVVFVAKVGIQSASI